MLLDRGNGALYKQMPIALVNQPLGYFLTCKTCRDGLLFCWFRRKVKKKKWKKRWKKKTGKRTSRSTEIQGHEVTFSLNPV